jgi:hypothetical protein
MAEARANNPVLRVVVLSADAPVRAALADAAGLRSPQAPPGAECVVVQSPYEAAAELVAGPAIALVVDLRLMSPRHLRLLQIGRERNVELLAVGGVPAGLTPEDLSGVRLVARADLKAALERVVAGASARLGAGPSAGLGAGRAVALVAEAAGPARAVSAVERPAAGAIERPAAGAVERPVADDGQYVSEEVPPRDESRWEPEEPPRATSRRGAAAQRPGAAGPADADVKRARERHEPAPAPASAPAEESPRPAMGPAPRSILTKEELAALLEDKP